MSSLLLPVVVESCPSLLRERRRSSINPLNALKPTSGSGYCPSCEGSALVDELEVVETVSPTASLIMSPTETVVQLPDVPSKLVSAQHYHAVDADQPLSPSATILENRRFSVRTLPGKVDPSLERLKWRLVSGYFAYFLCGWGDGVTGTMLPYLMTDYHVNFMTSSSLYAASTLGFMSGTFLVETIVNKLGCFDVDRSQGSWIPSTNLLSRFFPQKRKEIGYSPTQARFLALMFASTLHSMFFVMMGTEAGFWVSFGAYIVAAFARAILTASLNQYFSSGLKGSIGYAFGLWSFGGAVSPLVCQSAVDGGVPWPKFYLGSLVLSATNVVFLVLTFKPTAAEFLHDRSNASMKRALLDSKDSNQQSSTAREQDIESKISKKPRSSKGPADKKSLLTSLKLPYQWAISLFALVYCGCETTTQSFMVSYLLGTRHANPGTVGYVTSGFWGGITIGRCIWGFFTSKLTYTQRKFVILGCIRKPIMSALIYCLTRRRAPVTGLTMQILIWKVDSNIENSLSTSIIGIVYGPVFPACLTLATDILPAEVRMVSMALISASGSAGAALFPFITGTISSSEGVKTLVYITVPLAGTITCLWALFPSQIPLQVSTGSL